MFEKAIRTIESKRFLRGALISGIAMTAFAGTYLAQHEIHDPQQAIGTVNTDFSDLTFGLVNKNVEKYVDDNDLAVAALGIGGAAMSTVSAMMLHEQRKEEQQS
jgi:hypothetical protein